MNHLQRNKFHFHSNPEVLTDHHPRLSKNVLITFADPAMLSNATFCINGKTFLKELSFLSNKFADRYHSAPQGPFFGGTTMLLWIILEGLVF